jgi:Transglutaminase-like superfamily
MLFRRAYWNLVLFDFYLARRDFSRLYHKVRACPLRRKTTPPRNEIERVCSTVDKACIWYWKEVLCLQRSAATASLLRFRGVPAEMVVGAQIFPFKAHAWVEVDGVVVNDRPYVREMYTVLDRF